MVPYSEVGNKEDTTLFGKNGPIYNNIKSMYKKSQKITGRTSEISNYVEGIDIFNSTLLYKLTDPLIEREGFEITVEEYRPDLIAQKYYSNRDYLPYVILSCGLSLDQYKKGNIIRLIPKKILEEIIGSV